jgi:Aspartyl/Asparaginyl beta-hydroxylase.
MRLPRPFFQLPVLFETARLQSEVAAVPPEAWVPHPDNVPGNSAVRLISAGGGETDGYNGQMLPTTWLAAMPYLRQVLATFGVVWSRSRLMRLAPGRACPSMPTSTTIGIAGFGCTFRSLPGLKCCSTCDGQTVHMAAGEAWIFDNWRRHHVENDASEARVHLVADTTGTAAFWQFACGQAPPREQWRTIGWDRDADPQLLTENDQRSPIMPAAEVQLLVDDLRAELATSAETPEAKMRAARFSQMLEAFVLDWRQLCALHGIGGRGEPSSSDSPPPYAVGRGRSPMAWSCARMASAPCWCSKNE